MADIHVMAETGQSIIEPMRTRQPTFAWDDILIKGAQLSKLPLNHDQPVNTKTIIGLHAAHPLEIESPVYITHMSFGALSREAKVALAKGSAAVKTAMCSGEGGILPESLESSYKYIFEYVPNEYSVTEEDLKNKVAWLRDVSEGKPIGIKFAAGNIEADLEVALYAQPDFITIDGRAGATGAAPKFVKSAASIPTIFTVYRARKFLDSHGATDMSLIATGGLRISPDFAKALALGATAVAVGTVALIAIGCRQYRICNTGKCPMGITTQDSALRKRLEIDDAAKRLESFLRVTNEELKDFARLTGNDDIHELSMQDLCTTNSEISEHTEIEHV
jgi:glutamate synthase domain-containing protein 2